MEAEDQHKAKVMKIKSPFQFVVKDITSQETILLELEPHPSLKQKDPKTIYFYHLLQTLSEEPITYTLTKKTFQFRNEFKLANIYLRN